MPNLTHLTLDYLSTAIILLDDESRVTYLNTAAENLFEVSGRNLIKQTLQSVFVDTTQLFSAMQRALRNHASYIEHELMLTTHAHNKLHVRCTVTPVRLGNALSAAGIPSDGPAVETGARRADAGSDSGQSIAAAQPRA
jgi:two-component system nitrogen regulation sensor histidine kinase GlnL